MASKDGATDILVTFARLVASVEGASDVLPRLATALREHLGAEAVVVVAIGDDGVARVVETQGLRAPLGDLAIDIDELGHELGRNLLAAIGPPCSHELTRLLVAEGNLFGAVVGLFRAPIADEERIRLADGLVDLAALALGNKAYVARIERSHADLRASQELLARTEKVRALGQMAAGVSHDLMNILNPISCHLQLLERAIERGKVETAKESAVEIRNVLRRGLETIQRLRDYSRQSPEPKSEIVDLNALAREAVAIAKPRLSSARSSARIVEELQPIPRIRAHGGEVLSALVNLVVNAIDVLSGRGGTITLRSGESQGGVWVSVHDDGPGMPPEVQKRVFEPFFTTKGADGTGLGLAMVFACMERHGGTIGLASAAAEGTTFKLWFPGESGVPSRRTLG